jgi:hypothetical protein
MRILSETGYFLFSVVASLFVAMAVGMPLIAWATSQPGDSAFWLSFVGIALLLAVIPLAFYVLYLVGERLLGRDWMGIRSSVSGT